MKQKLELPMGVQFLLHLIQFLTVLPIPLIIIAIFSIKVTDTFLSTSLILNYSLHAIIFLFLVIFVELQAGLEAYKWWGDLLGSLNSISSNSRGRRK